jgi:hypothetical protein
MAVSPKIAAVLAKKYPGHAADVGRAVLYAGVRTDDGARFVLTSGDTAKILWLSGIEMAQAEPPVPTPRPIKPSGEPPKAA